MSKPTDLVQGTLDMLLLKILGLEPSRLMEHLRSLTCWIEALPSVVCEALKHLLGRTNCRQQPKVPSLGRRDRSQNYTVRVEGEQRQIRMELPPYRSSETVFDV